MIAYTKHFYMHEVILLLLLYLRLHALTLQRSKHHTNVCNRPWLLIGNAGQRVFGQVEGSLGSHVLAPWEQLVPLPPEVTLQQASTMPTVFMTAHLALQMAMHSQPGTHLLIHATAGKTSGLHQQVSTMQLRLQLSKQYVKWQHCTQMSSMVALPQPWH